MIRNIEEDQKLPSKEILEDVCQVLLNVSCMREEGRFPSFRVCFVQPESELLDTYIYAHVLLFKSPIYFGTRELHKLAPALNPDMSYLMLDIRQKPYKAVGIIAAYTSWEKIMTREISSGNRMPRIPNILVSGPGELRACFGEASIVNYSSGNCVFFRTNTFTSTLIAGQLADGATVSEKDRLRLLYRILWHVANYHHGGAIMIVPSAESCEEFIDLKYQLASRFMFNNGHRLDYISDLAREKEIITYADLIAKLTSVDGSVVLTKDLDLLGSSISRITVCGTGPGTASSTPSRGAWRSSSLRMASLKPVQSMTARSSSTTISRCRFYESYQAPAHASILISIPPSVSISAPHERVTICAKGSSSIRSALERVATFPDPPMFVVHIPAAMADSIG